MFTKREMNNEENIHLVQNTRCVTKELIKTEINDKWIIIFFKIHLLLFNTHISPSFSVVENMCKISLLICEFLWMFSISLNLSLDMKFYFRKEKEEENLVCICTILHFTWNCCWRKIRTGFIIFFQTGTVW